MSASGNKQLLSLQASKQIIYMRLPILILLSLVSSVGAASSQQAIEKLLGVVPGRVSQLHAKSIGGAPFESVRIPTPSAPLSSVFSDLEIGVSNDSRRIVGVRAERAFSSLQACKAAEEKVRSQLQEVLPDKYSGPDPRWQYRSSELGITGGAYCGTPEGSPHPTLILDITHTATNNEILKYFKRVE